MKQAETLSQKSVSFFDIDDDKEPPIFENDILSYKISH